MRTLIGYLQLFGGLVVLIAILAPVIAPFDPNAMQTTLRFAPVGAPGSERATPVFAAHCMKASRACRMISGSCGISLP